MVMRCIRITVYCLFLTLRKLYFGIVKQTNHQIQLFATGSEPATKLRCSLHVAWWYQETIVLHPSRMIFTPVIVRQQHS